MLLSPALGGPLQAVGAAVRYAGHLTDRERELAILVVAARWASDFEWSSHEAIARHIGLSDEEIEAVRADIAPPLADPREAAVIAWTRGTGGRVDGGRCSIRRRAGRTGPGCDV